MIRIVHTSSLPNLRDSHYGKMCAVSSIMQHARSKKNGTI